MATAKVMEERLKRLRGEVVPREVLLALEDLLAQVHQFTQQHGEADFETGRAQAAIDLCRRSAA